MVEFADWHMPIQYESGIIREHLATRRTAGLFDVSHMGRVVIRGKSAVAFLQHSLTANCAGLDAGKAQYTMIPNNDGGAFDDAYLYRFLEDEYLLVVNAANLEKDLIHLRGLTSEFSGIELIDRTDDLAMLSLQGPASKEIMGQVVEEGGLPEPFRNALSRVLINGFYVWVARTGYTGEPIGFELFLESGAAAGIWDLLLEKGAAPIGLGGRDTLRLEAGLPLYGHELGKDPSGEEIPIFACPLARFATSFSPSKGDFIGKSALMNQFRAFQRILKRNYGDLRHLARRIRPLALLERGVARAGAEVFQNERRVGWVTSGTTVPYWKTEGEGLHSFLTEEKGMRTVCLALIDSSIRKKENVEVEIRGRRIDAMVVPCHLRSEAPPFARAVLYEAQSFREEAESAVSVSEEPYKQKVDLLLQDAIDNTRWRQSECINLIPSEQTQSPMTRLLSVMDPAFRYGEHKRIKALDDVNIFFYQGTDFIGRVERLLEEEMRTFLGCRLAETRLISGQMANMAVFSALVDYLNRIDRKAERRKIRSVMNNHILKGGHLSAQPMGALRDFVAIDPLTEKSAIIAFPVLSENPYKIDMAKTEDLIARHEPELIILGKSLIIHREPVAEIRRVLDDLSLDTVLMYDMAHVLGLAGPFFQQPLAEGADIVTGSTHKTFFGTQRGIVAADCEDDNVKYPLWTAVERRSFPGSVSNHHLGTLLGLLVAAYEMNHFKADYQRAVIANAKALARSLADLGMDVAGDPRVSYTETHQVILNVGFNRGIDAARKLEGNNIIVNYQAVPGEEGFTVSGALRLGVAEMTRFGMKEPEFQKVAELIHDALIGGRGVREEATALRSAHRDLQYCFTGREFEDKIEQLHRLV